jgi:hypothetical protein
VLRPDIHSIHQSANLYVYTMNNPIMFIDPTGLSSDFSNGVKIGFLIHTDSVLQSIVNPVGTTINFVVATVDNPLGTLDALLLPFMSPSQQAVRHRMNMNIALRQGGEYGLGIYLGEYLGQTATMIVCLAAGGYAAKASGATTASTGGTRVAAGSTGLAGKTAIGGTRVASGSATTGTATGRATNHLRPNPSATGAHTTYRTNPTTGRITHYETWTPNPRNPSGFDSAIRYDGVGRPHNNLMPHVHDRLAPGGVRAPHPWEFPG